MSLSDLDDEMQEMFETGRSKTLSTQTIQQPIRALELQPAVTADISATVSSILAVMQEKKIGCVIVTKQGVLAGIFTERDVLMRVVGKRESLSSMRIGDVMTPDPEALQLDDTIAYAMNLMSVGGYRHVPIIDGDRKPTSVLSVKDIVTYIVEHFPDEVLNLPPKPLRSTSEREGA